jgi:micrococcal nuclease
VLVIATSTPADGTSNCLIKGNISSSGKKIYHVPGGALYKVVKPKQCFNTKAQAVAAGFVKSKR